MLQRPLFLEAAHVNLLDSELLQDSGFIWITGLGYIAQYSEFGATDMALTRTVNPTPRSVTHQPKPADRQPSPVVEIDVPPDTAASQAAYCPSAEQPPLTLCHSVEASQTPDQPKARPPKKSAPRSRSKKSASPPSSIDTLPV